MVIRNFWADIKESDQYVAINQLILESQESSKYYALLILSIIIIASGILLANSAILIGGMLITPMLTPILLVALGIVTGRTMIIVNTSRLIFKSLVVIFVVSFAAGLIFPIVENKEFFSEALFNDSLRSAFLYFLVAFASGIAATFSWIRKDISNNLPTGIAMAVSLVSPISLAAIWLAHNDFILARFFLIIFLFNLVGVLMGSMIVFSMLKFYRNEKYVIENFTNGINGNFKKDE